MVLCWEQYKDKDFQQKKLLFSFQKQKKLPLTVWHAVLQNLTRKKFEGIGTLGSMNIVNQVQRVQEKAYQLEIVQAEYHSDTWLLIWESYINLEAISFVNALST